MYGDFLYDRHSGATKTLEGPWELSLLRPVSVRPLDKQSLYWYIDGMVLLQSMINLCSLFQCLCSSRQPNFLQVSRKRAVPNLSVIFIS